MRRSSPQSAATTLCRLAEITCCRDRNANLGGQWMTAEREHLKGSIQGETRWEASEIGPLQTSIYSDDFGVNELRTDRDTGLRLPLIQ